MKSPVLCSAENDLVWYHICGLSVTFIFKQVYIVVVVVCPFGLTAIYSSTNEDLELYSVISPEGYGETPPQLNKVHCRTDGFACAPKEYYGETTPHHTG